MAENGNGQGTVKLVGGIIVGIVTVLAVALSFLDGRVKPIEQGQEREGKQIRELMDRDKSHLSERVQDLDGWRDSIRDELTRLRERIASIEARLEEK